MQTLPIYLYPNTIDAILDLDPTILGVNRIMYQRDLTLQKGLKNQIRVQFKNSDQKRVSISNTQTFVFSLIDMNTQQLILTKSLEILETNTATRGLALLTLNENDTIDLDRSSYKYSVKLSNNDGSYSPTYADTYYSAAGTAYLLNDIDPVLKPSQEIKEFQKSFNGETFLYEHKSGNLYSYPNQNGNSALHTLAFYLTGYKGTVLVQGTLSNSPHSFGKYATIASRTYNGFTGIDHLNFNGVFSYIRVMHIPAKAGSESDNDNPSYYGKFDKLLYRS